MTDEQTANVYRARHIKTGNIHYLVGSYSHEEGRYYCPADHRAKRQGLDTVFGNYSYCPKYATKAAAESQAKQRYGYAKIVNAGHDSPGNLGDDYETIR